MNEQKIKEAGYALWERDGTPDGHDLEHWFRASAELDDDGVTKGDSRRRSPRTTRSDGDSPSASIRTSSAEKRKRQNV